MKSRAAILRSYGGENQAVQPVFDPVDHRAVAGDLFDTAAAGVDQGDVVAVGGLQVLVVEAGPFAEVAVPGFERFGGSRIGHHRIDAAVIYALTRGLTEQAAQLSPAAYRATLRCADDLIRSTLL